MPSIENGLKIFRIFINSRLGIGNIFVKRPWGLPKYSCMCHPHFIYSIILNGCNAFLWYDFYYKITSELLEEHSLVDKILFVALIISFNFFDVFFRVVLIIYRKQIPKLLVELETVKFAQVHNDFEKCRKFYCLFRLLLLLPRLVCPVIILCWYYQNVPAKSSILPNTTWYYISFFIFAEIPIMLSIIFIYDLILVTTFCIIRTFEDFARSTHEAIISRCHLFSETGSSQNFSIEQKNGISPTPSFVVINDADSIQAVTKDGLRKFENLETLSKKYDRVIGPLIFGIIVRSVFMIVHSANSLLFAEPVMESRKQGFIKDAFDVLMLIIELSQLLTLLQLGSEVVNRVSFHPFVKFSCYAQLL